MLISKQTSELVVFSPAAFNIECFTTAQRHPALIVPRDTLESQTRTGLAFISTGFITIVKGTHVTNCSLM